MNKKALTVLEYNRIIEMLAGFSGSVMAKERIRKFSPRSDIAYIRDLLDETSEALEVIVKKGSLPIGEIYDIENSLHLAKKGGSLSMKQLLMVLYNMKVAENCIRFLRSDLPRFEIIHGKAEMLVTFPKLSERIDRSILSEDEMADSASPELARIRRDILRENDSIRAKLNSIVNSQLNRTYLQDAIITMRDGRYVVPVKAEHRQRINGIVHNQSGSGSTLFIEPQAIVEANNRLREMELAEHAEIVRILQELTDNVAEHFYDLMNNQKLLIELDIIFAKGKLSASMGAEAPKISEGGFLNLKEARHPLIDKKKVVPVNVYIGDEFRTLVITGPNTGGKTVSLKTIGLLSMMAQTGLHIPASSQSVVPVFKDIFADIGDEQSIEQSLSTFSSHMRNTVEYVSKARKGTLVLLDELGAGTDPTEGAALAIAILETLYENGATTVATTHYNELKKYAISTAGVENASMEFDVETLSPTYRLSIGVPGKSNAFEISRKLGLPDKVIDRANLLIEHGDMKFEDVLSKIEKDKKKAEDERLAAEAAASEIARKEAALDRRLMLLDKHEKQVLAEAKEQARGIIKEAKDTASEVQKELRNLSKVGSLGERNKKLEENKRRLGESLNRYSDGIIKEVNDKPILISDIKIGDKVKVLTLDQTGEIIGPPDEGGKLQVKVGPMKIFISVEDLMLVQGGPEGVNLPKQSKYAGRTAKPSSSLYRQKAMNISSSVNVVGKNLDDASEAVSKYLDDCYVGGLKEATIIHGRGAGILQSGLRQMLSKMSTVDSYRKGKFDEGGDGVTVVRFKE